MKRVKLGILVFCIVTFSSRFSFGNEWYDWVKNSLYDSFLGMKFAYETLSIPGPNLLKKDTFNYIYNQRERLVHTFFYDISRDSEELRKIRTFCSNYIPSGFYFDVNTYLTDDEKDFVFKELKNKYGNNVLYQEMQKKYGHDYFFREINACMKRFLTYELKYICPEIRSTDKQAHLEINYNSKLPKKQKEAIIQFLWELEGSLSSDFDKDETGEKFIQLIQESSPEKKDALFEFSYAHYAYARALAWKAYSRRFFRNKGLDKAINHFKREILKYLS